MVDSRFSPFGIALFAVGIIAILLFAFLMTERGDGRTDGRIDTAEEVQQMNAAAPATE